MKRVAVNSSVEDFDRVSREYDEAVARRDRQQKERDRQYKQYSIRLKASQDIIVENIRNLIEDATDSDFMRFVDIRAHVYSRHGGTIAVSYGENNKFDDDVPLVWSWTFELGKYGNDNEIDRATNSWSGLNATTAQNVEVLKKCVSALEALSQVDDSYIVSLIRENAVAQSDYVSQKVDKVDKDSYLMRKLDALAGTDRYILIDDTMYYSDYSNIEKDTGKQYSVETIRVTRPSKSFNYRTEEYETNLSRKFVIEDKRYRKDKFLQMVVNPLKVVTMDDIDAMMKKWDEEFTSKKED